jgi:hypothetical protein
MYLPPGSIPVRHVLGFFVFLPQCLTKQVREASVLRRCMWGVPSSNLGMITGFPFLVLFKSLTKQVSAVYIRESSFSKVDWVTNDPKIFRFFSLFFPGMQE